MEMQGIWLFLHILLFVFWLGTDLGVFLLAAKISERGDLGVEARATVLQLGMVLDRMPRTCMALIFASGLQLAASGGYVAVDGLWLGLVWLASIGWAAVLWAGFLNPGTPTEALSHKINLAMNAVLAIGLLGLAAATLIWASPALAAWLGLKILMVGLIGVCGVALDLAFAPAAMRFARIAGGETSDEINAQYSVDLVPVYRWVLAIYALTSIAALLGATKAL